MCPDSGAMSIEHGSHFSPTCDAYHSKLQEKRKPKEIQIMEAGLPQEFRVRSYSLCRH